MNIFDQVFKELNKEKVKYLVVGGVAVNLHGYVRFTGDLDILLLLEEKNLQNMDKVMKKLKYSERLPASILELKDRKKVKEWLKAKNLKAFSFIPPAYNLLQIDVIMEESLKFDKIYKKSTKKIVNNVRIPLISIEDLIKMKKKANRGQDLIDLKALLELKGI